MDIATVQFLLQLVGVLWIVFAALLLVAAVMLMLGARHRYAVGIAAFSLPCAISLVWVIGVQLIDKTIMDRLVEKAGVWVSFLFPHVIETTSWPWVVLIASAAGIVVLAILAQRAKALKE